MAQQVVIAGALFNDVPSISVPDSNSVWHPFVDPSVTTAAASDVASGKQFIAADGTLTSGSATAPVLTTKSITANGTYNASSDSADGYSSVTVNVSGGASNYVSGKFTVPNSTNTVQTISIPYTGSGYPVLVVIVPEAGAYNTNGPIYAVTQQYATIMFVIAKGTPAFTPDYTGSGTSNNAEAIELHKGTSKTNTTVSRTNGAFSYTQSNPTASTSNVATIYDAKTLKYYVASSSYGLMAGIEYRYHVVYSS